MVPPAITATWSIVNIYESSACAQPIWIPIPKGTDWPENWWKCPGYPQRPEPVPGSFWGAPRSQYVRMPTTKSSSKGSGRKTVCDVCEHTSCSTCVSLSKGIRNFISGTVFHWMMLIGIEMKFLWNPSCQSPVHTVESLNFDERVACVWPSVDCIQKIDAAAEWRGCP